MSHWPHLGQVAEDALACEQGWLGRVIAVAGQRDLNRCCCQICANVHWPGKLHSHMDFDTCVHNAGVKAGSLPCLIGMCSLHGTMHARMHLIPAAENFKLRSFWPQEPT